LDFINGKPKKAVEHLVSVIKPATLKALIERKLEMNKSELKKDFLESVGYPKKMTIIHGEHCHVMEHKNTGDSGMKNNGKGSDAGSRSSGHNSGGSSHGGASNKASDRDRTKSGHGRSSDSMGTGNYLMAIRQQLDSYVLDEDDEDLYGAPASVVIFSSLSAAPSTGKPASDDANNY
jgi:hypothetical protein